VKRVLVVEHDNLHRELIREWLEAAGAQAVLPEAANVPANIDAILVDVACQQQAHTVLLPWRQAYPHAAIVLASGRFCREDMANDAMALRLGATRVLAKPYGRGDLWAALDLLTEPTAPAHPQRR
jgi:DNA-binding response OmpR family regulator